MKNSCLKKWPLKSHSFNIATLILTALPLTSISLQSFAESSDNKGYSLSNDSISSMEEELKRLKARRKELLETGKNSPESSTEKETDKTTSDTDSGAQDSEKTKSADSSDNDDDTKEGDNAESETPSDAAQSSDAQHDGKPAEETNTDTDDAKKTTTEDTEEPASENIKDSDSSDTSTPEDEKDSDSSTDESDSDAKPDAESNNDSDDTSSSKDKEDESEKNKDSDSTSDTETKDSSSNSDDKSSQSENPDPATLKTISESELTEQLKALKNKKESIEDSIKETEQALKDQQSKSLNSDTNTEDSQKKHVLQPKEADTKKVEQTPSDKKEEKPEKPLSEASQDKQDKKDTSSSSDESKKKSADNTSTDKKKSLQDSSEKESAKNKIDIEALLYPELTKKKAQPEDDGLTPFYRKLVREALKRTRHKVRYDGRYRYIKYPWGDVPKNIGVCTDVLIRSYRKMGIDLQQLVHHDMSRNFHLYPSRSRWGLARPDPNIDHRRVYNLQVFFKRFGQSLPISHRSKDYKPGDLVTWRLGPKMPHIGIVVNKRSPRNKNRYMIVHNIGKGPKLEDILFAFPITGHYRYQPSQPVPRILNPIRNAQFNQPQRKPVLSADLIALIESASGNSSAPAKPKRTTPTSLIDWNVARQLTRTPAKPVPRKQKPKQRLDGIDIEAALALTSNSSPKKNTPRSVKTGKISDLDAASELLLID